MSAATEYAIRTLALENYAILSPNELVILVKESLLVREGESLTPDVAEERARNIAAALVRTLITEG